MKPLMIISFIVGVAGFALAAAPEHKHVLTPAMRWQHNAMSVTNKQWTACKKSLEAGDFAAASTALEGMQKTASALEGFKLHKNSEMTEKFKEQADSYRKNLAELAKAIREKDKTRTQSLSATIDNSCVQCHTVFR
ncbi:MAG TPA: hypothetical protein VJZ49_03690 [Syntrophales bacterium]|nr:hypothetical protein [Syntrophales bacterium]